MKNKIITRKSLSVFGMGYVGLVTGACLAAKGCRVIGVDVNPEKVLLINKGKSPVIEKGIDKIVSKTVKAKMFLATTSAKYAVLNTGISMICVGTPSMEDGRINVEHLRSVSEEIGKALRLVNRYHIIVVRSTVLPGTTENIVIPSLEKSSGKKAFRDFGVLVNPEFMREGDSMEDFYYPAKIIVGSFNGKDKEAMSLVYDFIKMPIIDTDIKTAEFSKYLDNIFHALKISFANEIGKLSGNLGVDGKKAMELLCMDKKSNISARYLRPGFAFGGSCLPKDLKAALCRIRTDGLTLPLLESVQKSNDLCIQRAFEEIIKTKKKKIGMLGLSFKPGTDDLRESQMVKLAEYLIGKGFDLKIYDKNVSMARIMGANKAYIQKEIPHVSSLLCGSLGQVIKSSEVVILGHPTQEFKNAVKGLKKGQILINLT